MKRFIGRFLNDDRGVTAIEYALIAGLIAVAIVGSLNDVTTKLTTVFQNIVNAL